MMTQLRCHNVVSLAVNQYTHAIVLVVSTNEWELYTYPEFRHLLHVRSSHRMNLAGGKFVSISKVLVWYQVRLTHFTMKHRCS